MAAVNSRVNLSDTVLEKLEEMVSKKKPGDRLPTEAELSEQFSVGRSTIRESMKVLAAKRMIVRRNEGTFVADMMKGCFVDPLNMIINMSTGDLNSLIELREILELSAAQLASQRATAEDVLELQRANWMMKEPGLTPEELTKRDIAFHARIAQCTGNTVIVELLNAIREVIARNVEEGHSFGANNEYHGEMIDAIAKQDPEKAKNVMQRYFDSVYEALGI